MNKVKANEVLSAIPTNDVTLVTCCPNEFLTRNDLASNERNKLPEYTPLFDEGYNIHTKLHKEVQFWVSEAQLNAWFTTAAVKKVKKLAGK